MFLWFALAAVPSTLLLATTNQACADIASVPFHWVLPLSLYLLSFILCFDSDHWYNRSLFGFSLIIFAIASCFLLWDAAMGWQISPWIAAQSAIFFGLLFCSCMVCLRHLADDGILVIHITNRHVDLKPVCNGLAREFSLASLVLTSQQDPQMGTSPAMWVLMSRSEKSLTNIDPGKTHTHQLSADSLFSGPTTSATCCL